MSLIINNLTARFGATAPLINGLSFEVTAERVTTVMGPSGVGKSTLLAAIGGFLGEGAHISGQILLDGRDITYLRPEQRRVGLLFQDSTLFPHMSVGSNLGFGLPRHVRGRAARRAAVIEALRRAGLEGFADRDPATLSGGQIARATLMRLILAEPRALLLDEPFAKLDQALRASVRRFVFDQALRASVPVLMVTHDPDDAEAAGGNVITLR